MLPKTVAFGKWFSKYRCCWSSWDMVQAMQIVKNKPKDFLVISGDIWLLCQWFLLECRGYIRYSRVSRRVFWNDTVRLKS
jgi:hypothetical protein